MARSERTYLLVLALYSASWSALTPVYTLFLLSRRLDLFEINVVFAVYLITAFLFEVPTGALADTVGRKTSFLLSCLLRSVAFWMYWFAEGFADCVLAEFVDAVGTTLASGALDAWAVDGMRGEGHEGPMTGMFARAQLITRPLMIAAGVGSGYLADVDIALPWLVGAGGFVLTGAIAALLMREPERAGGTHAAACGRGRRGLRGWRGSGGWRGWTDTTRRGFAAVRADPLLLLLCALTAITSFAVMPSWHYWPARLTELSGGGVWLMGWVWALIGLASMAGAVAMPRLLANYRREHVLAAAWLWRGVTLALAAAATTFLPALAGVVLTDAAFGVTEPIALGWMNEHVDAERRATVLSVRSMAFTLGGGVGLLCLGLVARAWGIPAAWAAAATLLLLAAPGFLLLGRPGRARNPTQPAGGGPAASGTAASNAAP